MKAIATLLVVSMLGFTGGTTANQWLNADGTLAAPSYSFSAEPDFGLYRKGATQICNANANDTDSLVCFDDGQILVSSDGTQLGAISMATGASVATGWRYLDSTSDFNVWTADSTTLDLAIGTYGGDAAIASTGVALATTYLHRMTNTAGTLAMLGSTGSAWSTSHGFGYTGFNSQLSIGDKMRFVDGTTTIHQATTDELTYTVGSAVIAYSRNKDLLEAATGKYIRTSPKNSNVVDTECDATGDQGNFAVDYGDNRVYVCNFDGGDTWMYFDLTE